MTRTGEILLALARVWPWQCWGGATGPGAPGNAARKSQNTNIGFAAEGRQGATSAQAHKSTEFSMS